MSETKTLKQRIPILDEIRGLSVIVMIAYHTAFTWGNIFSLPVGKTMLAVLEPIHYVIPFPFVFISGICTKLSRSNLRRGLILMIPALIINAVTIVADKYISGIAIYFGVINMLSAVMILYGITGKYIEKLPSRLSFGVCMILFMVTWGIKLEYMGIFGIRLVKMPEVLYKNKFMFPIGFPTRHFVSSDYFPLIPWFFLFLAGAYFADMMKHTSRLKSDKLYNRHSRFLEIVGKYALYIYIAHQPVIFALTYVYINFIGK